MTLKELEEATKSMEPKKTPGKDGLPVEFYKELWDQVGPCLLKVWEELVSKVSPFPSQWRCNQAHS